MICVARVAFDENGQQVLLSEVRMENPAAADSTRPVMFGPSGEPLTDIGHSMYVSQSGALYRLADLPVGN